MQRQIITGGRPDATPNPLLELIETAHSNALNAQRQAEGIENLEEVTMGDLAAIASRCGAALKALETLRTSLADQGDAPTPTPAVARRAAHLSLVTAVAA